METEELMEFREYMKDGREFREEVVKHMVTTNINTANFLEYVRQCESERTLHDKRIAEVETEQKVQKGIIAAGMAALALVGTFMGIGAVK